MGKIIIANITWNSNDWKGISNDPSNFGYVRDGGLAHESWNFDFEQNYNKNEENRIYGFFQAKHNPTKLAENGNLIIFYSNSKIIGFYVDGKIETKKIVVNHSIDNENFEYEMNSNISGNKDLSFVLENKIDVKWGKGFLYEHKQTRYFCYLNDYINVKNLLEKILTLNPNQKEQINKLTNWFNDNFEDDNDSEFVISKDIFFPLNQILYGPPGTGKTYITKRKSLEIIAENEFDENKIDELYEQYKNQIKFVTFHQSYSYEQFVEGISVLTENGNPIYKIKDGIFKQVAESAKFEFLYAVLIHKLNSEKEIQLKTVKQQVQFSIKLNNNDSIVAVTNGGSEQPLTKEYLFQRKFFNAPVNISYFDAVLDYMYSEEFKVNHNDLKEVKKFVLIIDEINRGNISKIFGELITLIEDDKRLREDNEIIVKLPYSQTDFGVPPNLHIIGTMNTADRSLVQLDTALRRRFIFEPMYPKPELIPNFEINMKDEWENITETNANIDDLQSWFIELNNFIVKTIDKEHQIGHSYFMKIKNNDDLQFNLTHKILPLLEEYYYHNDNNILDKLNKYCQIEIENEIENSEIPQISHEIIKNDYTFKNTSLKFENGRIQLNKNSIKLKNEQISILESFVDVFDKKYEISKLYFTMLQRNKKEFSLGLNPIKNQRNHIWLSFRNPNEIDIKPPLIAFKMDETIQKILIDNGIEKDENFDSTNNSKFGVWNGYELWQKMDSDGAFLYLPVNKDNIDDALNMIVQNEELWKAINE